MDTTTRVVWTHTLNCANDHVPSAIHEMVGTWRDAELLKQEAGIRRGGRALERPVKHFSLNWHPEEKPDQARMIEAAVSYLTHMGWQEHQAVLVCHTDKAHPHVHVMLNAVHPETGRKLGDGLEKRRSQQWALAYEREHDRIYCPQRLAPVAQREPAPPRPSWMAMKEAEPMPRCIRAAWRAAAPRPEAMKTRIPAGNEKWPSPKDGQRKARTFQFEDGQAAFRDLRSAVFREVREEFRGEWAAYHAAHRAGLDGHLLQRRRAGLVARQATALIKRRDAAFAAIPECRKNQRAVRPTTQCRQRAALSARQAEAENAQASSMQPVAVQHPHREIKLGLQKRVFLCATGSDSMHRPPSLSPASASFTKEAKPYRRQLALLGERAFRCISRSASASQRRAAIQQHFNIRLAGLVLSLPRDQLHAARRALLLEQALALGADKALAATERAATKIPVRGTQKSVIDIQKAVIKLGVCRLRMHQRREKPLPQSHYFG